MELSRLIKRFLIHGFDYSNRNQLFQNSASKVYINYVCESFTMAVKDLLMKTTSK